MFFKDKFEEPDIMKTLETGMPYRTYKNGNRLFLTETK